ncbi:MAG: DUF2339 domain-containing protein, partial [Pseudomonadales bacterium]
GPAPAADWAPRAAARAPGALARGLRQAVTFFTTGNPVVRIGVVVLFLGVAFLLRWAYENALLPIELRLAGAALGGIVLTAIGWRLRARADSYGVVLQGAGVGLLYLTIFAAARLYPLLPMAAAFAALVVLVAASSLLAVVQRAQALAVFASSGGFLAPVLLSTGEGSHVALFSYYALLNAGILAMALFRSWRWLNWLGFLFTFVISASWGYRYYRPEWFASTEPFLILFFLFYLAVAILFARRRDETPTPLVDGTLVFGMPLAAFALQWGLVRDMPFGMAYSALAAAAAYLLAGWWLSRQTAYAALLKESFLALAVVFATLAIPFAFGDQRVTAGLWALEGAALVWVGLRQARRLSRLAGLGLQLAAGFAYGMGFGAGAGAVASMPMISGDAVGAALLGLSALFSAWLLGRADPGGTPLHRWEAALRWPVLFWGLGWWAFAGTLEIGRFGDRRETASTDNLVDHLRLLFWALSAALLSLAGYRLRWREALAAGLLLLPLAVLGLLTLDAGWAQASPLAALGWLAWPGVFAALYAHLAARDAVPPAGRLGTQLSALWHAGCWWFLALFLGWLLASWLTPSLGGGWLDAAWGAMPLLLVLALVGVQRLPPRWPWQRHPGPYRQWGPGLLLGVLVLWVLLTGEAPAAPTPLPYVPLFNPLELVQLGVLLTAAALLRHADADSRGAGWLALGVAAFLWLNLVVARAVHHLGGVPYPLTRIVEADAFQTAASILWTTVALTLMGVAARRRQRALWIAGACVLALTVLKLFGVDLPRLEMPARIVSFIGAGVLMLLIGYLAPLPPARPTSPATPETTGT